MNHASIEDGCTVQGSVICSNVQLQEGCVLRDCQVKPLNFCSAFFFFFGHGSEINIFSSSGIHSFNPKLLIRGSSPPPLMSGWSRLCGHRRKRAQGRVIGEEVSRAFAPWSTSLCAHFIASSQVSPADLQKWVFFIISWYYFSSFLCDTRNGYHFLMIFELRLLYL